MAPPDGREPAFRSLYAAHFDAVLGFALRRTDRPEDAADVVADTFLVAWRRIRHVPPEPETRPWLYGVARRTLANQRRGERRRGALGERLRRELAVHVPDPSREVVQSATVDAVMRQLSGRDQQVLELHLWEGLEPREISEVLGIPTTVVRPRLSRARARLRDLLGDGADEDPGNDPEPPGHHLDVPPSRPVQLVSKDRP